MAEQAKEPQEAAHAVRKIVESLQGAQSGLTVASQRINQDLDKVRLLRRTGGAAGALGDLHELSADLFTATQALWEAVLELYRGVRNTP